MSEKFKENFLIEEYSRCWENLQHTDNLFWKVPTIAIAIVSFVYGALFFNFEKIPTSSVDLIIWVFTIITCFFLSILIIDLVKMRKYLVWRFEVCREIEKKFLGNGNDKLKLASYGETQRKTKWYMKYLSIMWFMPLVNILLIIGSIAIGFSLTSG